MVSQPTIEDKMILVFIFPVIPRMKCIKHHSKRIGEMLVRHIQSCFKGYGVTCGGLLGKAVIKNLLPSDTVLWKENVNMAAA